MQGAGGEMSTYKAIVTRDGKWWMISIPELNELTQARRLGEVEKMARELIAITLDVPISTIEVDVDVIAAGHVTNVSGKAKQIRQEREQAAQMERSARQHAEQFARELAAEDVPVRDIGAVLGVSYQRAHQLISK